jgi:2-polyprenyl-3-methyl-5-hydroxy-6-metoxy-1,4-benzoquinol methylase
MGELVLASCAICHSDRSDVMFVGTDLLHGIGGSFSVVKCANCGFVYLNPRPSPTDMLAYYVAGYEPHVGRIQARTSWLSSLDSQYGLEKMCRTVTKRRQPGRILDIGCATGDFLARMAHQGWSVQGIEMIGAAAAVARETYSLDVFTGSLEDAHLASHSFHAVTLWHVLEHLPDPKGSLVEIRRVLKEDGLLVIAVPNLDSWDARLFSTAWAGYDVPRHLSTFSPATLSRLLAATGFAVEDTNCLQGAYQSFAWSLRFRLRQMGLSDHGQKRADWLLRNRLVRLLAAPYFRFVGVIKRGGVMTFSCRPTGG